MIFIAIVDPQIGNCQRLIEIHSNWCKEVAKRLNEQFTMHIISNIKSENDIISPLNQILTNPNNYKNTIYLYYFCHGIRKDNKDYLKFGNNVFIRDDGITYLYFLNNVRHLTVFYECCHSQGLYEPTEMCYMEDQPATLYNVNVAFKSSKNNTPLYYKNNITIICTSLVNEKSLAGVDSQNNLRTQVTDILTTLKDNKNFNPNPYLNKVSNVIDYVNDVLKISMNGKQNMIVYSPNLLINWFY